MLFLKSLNVRTQSRQPGVLHVNLTQGTGHGLPPREGQSCSPERTPAQAARRWPSLPHSRAPAPGVPTGGCPGWTWSVALQGPSHRGGEQRPSEGPGEVREAGVAKTLNWSKDLPRNQNCTNEVAMPLARGHSAEAHGSPGFRCHLRVRPLVVFIIGT